MRWNPLRICRKSINIQWISIESSFTIQIGYFLKITNSLKYKPWKGRFRSVTCCIGGVTPKVKLSVFLQKKKVSTRWQLRFLLSLTGRHPSPVSCTHSCGFQSGGTVSTLAMRRPVGQGQKCQLTQEWRSGSQRVSWTCQPPHAHLEAIWQEQIKTKQKTPGTGRKTPSFHRVSPLSSIILA